MSTIRWSKGDRVFQWVNTIVLTLTLVIILYPLYFVLIASFSDPTAVARGDVFISIKGFQTLGYHYVLSDPDVLIGYRNSILYTVLGTIINLILTLTAGYALSLRFMGKTFLSLFFTFTMFFSGGMIPNYFLIRDLGMLDSVWALLLPGAVSVYNLFITRTFISGNISDSLYEAAEIDGCSHIRFFLFIVLPLSGVLIAILTLFYGLGHWNSYFNAILYITDRKKFPLQLVLREILILNKISASDIANQDPELLAQMQQVADTMKYSLIVVASVPFLVLYPFLQKYFVKGVMIGSIKG